MATGGVSYIFLDEGGNLDFRKSGSKYFTMTGVLMKRPFALESTLTELRFDMMEEGTELEEFHASEDLQATRDRVFANIKNNLPALRVDSVVVEKRKTHPKVQEVERFYPEMLGYLLGWMVRKEALTNASEVIVITDQLPVQKKRKAIEKAVKTTLKGMLPPKTRFRVLHHDSRSCCGLQVADYLNWAIYRKWKDGDNRSHKIVQSVIKSEFEIFRNGSTYYY